MIRIQRSRAVARMAVALVVTAASVTLVAGTAPAQTPAPPPAPAPACAAPENRQFDFWLGDWNVMNGDRLAGTNAITRLLGGCVILEHYVTRTGYEGWSHSLYDGARGKWHQTWVDNGGGLLLLEGGMVDGRMVLEGDRPAAGGGTVRNRISWSKLDAGRVRQHWETSTDDGRTWKTAFDGTYVRAGG